jgi:hypothetical protein
VATPVEAPAAPGAPANGDRNFGSGRHPIDGRFNRENPEALEQMRQPDRDAEGAVEPALLIWDLGRPAADLFNPPIKAPPSGQAMTRPDSNRSRMRSGG